MRVLRALSLDVVAGAACGGLLAEHMAGARMLPGWWIALLAAVWSIYTGDHLLDARHATETLNTFRHDFHRRHARSLGVALVIVMSIGLAAALTLRPPVRLFGVTLSIAVLVYLASAQGAILPRLPKEPVAGLLYAAGIWGGPLVMTVGDRGPMAAAALLHAAAAILNLAMLGVFEHDVDRQHGSRSLALRWGAATVRNAVLTASLMTTCLAIALSVLSPNQRGDVFAVLATQLSLPAVLLMASTWAARRERYRTWGDAVFLLGAAPRLLS